MSIHGVASPAVGAVGAAALLWTGRSAWGEGDVPGADSFAYFSTSLGLPGAGSVLLAAVAALGPAGVDWRSAQPGVLLVSLVSGLGIPAFFWLLFSIRYTGYGHVLTRRRVLALAAVPVAPLLSVGLVVAAATLPSGPAVDLLVSAVRVAATILGTAAFLFVPVAVLGGAALVGRTTYVYDHLPFGVGVGFAIGAVGGFVLFFFGGGASTLGTVASTFWLSLGLAGLAFAATLIRYDPFETTPAARSVGRATVVEELTDPVVVVDADGTVVDLNPAAERTLDAELSAVAGGPIDDLFDADVPSVDALADAELRVARDEDNRTYEVSVSALTDQHGTRLGRALVLHDVTAQRRRRQRLQVFNRVLRHNLRNDTSIVLARGEELLDGGDPDDHARPIVDRARALQELSEKASEVRTLTSVPASPTPRTALAETVPAVVDEVTADYPDAEVTVDVPEATAGVEGDLLRPVVANLVENVCEHAGASPQVRVTAESDGEGSLPVAVHVADDGPGLPDHERRVVLEGEESQLEHGSGLGLWVVKWGVARMGGELRFASSDLGGQRVTVRLPGDDERGVARTRLEVAAGGE